MHAYVQERNKVGRETELECWRVGSGVASNKWWDRLARQTEGRPAISIREEMATCCVCMCV